MTDFVEFDGSGEQIQYELGKLLSDLVIIEDGWRNFNLDVKVEIINIWDIFVPLRSDLHVDIDVRNGKPARIRLCLSHYCVVEFEGIGSTKDLLFSSEMRPSENVNAEFLKLLFKECSVAVEGGEPLGLSVIRKPLISAPLWKDGYKSNFASINLPSSLNSFSRIVLLGGPGSGKSTTLKAVSSALLEQHRSAGKSTGFMERIGIWDKRTTILPIFVSLREFVGSKYFPEIGNAANAEHLLSYIDKVVFRGSETFMRYARSKIQEGKVIFLLDGLDEIPVPHNVPDALDARRSQLKQLIRSVSTRFSKISIIVSSRPAGYSGWTLEGFQVVRILPLSNDESAELATALYRCAGLDEEQARSNAQDFIKKIAPVPLALRTQPLFLTLLAQLYNLRQGEPLPRKRGQLLKETMTFLIQTWSIRRTDKRSLTDLLGCEEGALFGRLSQIAYRATLELDRDASGETLITRGMLLDELVELGDHVNPAAVLNYVSQHAGILVSPAPRKYKFAHRQFQEYLAAEYLSAQDHWFHLVPQLLTENPANWEDTVLLLADVFHQSRSNEKIWMMISCLAETDKERLWWLASVILKEQSLADTNSQFFGAIGHMLRERIFGVLVNATLLTDRQRADMLLALDALGDTREGVGIFNNMPNISWVPIPAGSALIGTSLSEVEMMKTLGSDDWSFSREMPQHRVDVQAFEISKYPVTVAQYQLFVDAEDGFWNNRWWGCEGLAWRQAIGTPPPYTTTSRNCPQTYVNWYEAVAFCKWMTSITGRLHRLPTEVEWEWSARGPDGRLFPWGNNYEMHFANILGTDIDGVCGVGCFDHVATPWPSGGPMEMIGNVWEWCSSIVEENGRVYPYPYVSTDGRENEAGTNVLVATRGGYYDAPPVVARPAYRGRDLPSARFSRQGFRLVRQDV